MPYGITQCYLPSGSGDFASFALAEAGTRFSDPGRMQLSWVVVISQDSLHAKDEQWVGNDRPAMAAAADDDDDDDVLCLVHTTDKD